MHIHVDAGPISRFYKKVSNEISKIHPADALPVLLGLVAVTIKHSTTDDEHRQAICRQAIGTLKDALRRFAGYEEQ